MLTFGDVDFKVGDVVAQSDGDIELGSLQASSAHTNVVGTRRTSHRDMRLDGRLQ